MSDNVSTKSEIKTKFHFILKTKSGDLVTKPITTPDGTYFELPTINTIGGIIVNEMFDTLVCEQFKLKMNNPKIYGFGIENDVLQLVVYCDDFTPVKKDKQPLYEKYGFVENNELALFVQSPYSEKYREMFEKYAK